MSLHTSDFSLDPAVNKPLFTSSLLNRIFIDLQHLSSVKATRKFDVPGISGIGSYSDHVYALQRELLLLARSEGLISRLDKCCCLAALVYILVGLCDVSFASRFVEATIQSLAMELEVLASSDLEILVSIEDFAAEKLFWVGTVCYIALTGEETKQKIGDVLKMVLCWRRDDLHFGTQETLKAILWDDKWNSHLALLSKELRIQNK